MGQGTNGSNQAGVCSAWRPFIYLPPKPLFPSRTGSGLMPALTPVAMGPVSNARYLTSMLNMDGSRCEVACPLQVHSFACLFSPFSTHSPSHPSLRCPGFHHRPLVTQSPGLLKVSGPQDSFGLVERISCEVRGTMFYRCRHLPLDSRVPCRVCPLSLVGCWYSWSLCKRA